MKMLYFGYKKNPLVYWLYARDVSHLLKQIKEKGLGKPDWID